MVIKYLNAMSDCFVPKKYAKTFCGCTIQNIFLNIRIFETQKTKNVKLFFKVMMSFGVEWLPRNENLSRPEWVSYKLA